MINGILMNSYMNYRSMMPYLTKKHNKKLNIHWQHIKSTMNN